MNSLSDPVSIRSFEKADEPAVIALWRACNLVVPQNDPAKDIQRKLGNSPELFLVAEQKNTVIGAVMAGYEGHRGWINYLAVSPAHRRQGIGRQLMIAAEQKLRDLGCPKINLQVRKTNVDVIAFYQSIGFLEDNVLSFGKRLVHDRPTGASHV